MEILSLLTLKREKRKKKKKKPIVKTCERKFLSINIMGKEENAAYRQFSPFSHNIFSPFKTISIIQTKFELSSEKYFRSKKSKILLSGKGWILHISAAYN